jgi:hypothetical protein
MKPKPPDSGKKTYEPDFKKPADKKPKKKFR